MSGNGTFTVDNSKIRNSLNTITLITREKRDVYSIEVIANKDGTKTVISYRYNDDNKKVKVTRRIKTTIVREHVNPQVAERRKWDKFGLEKGHPAGPTFDTTSVGENIVFRPSVNWKANAKEAEKEGGEKGSMKDQLKDKKVKCRICSGEHFTARCPFKDTMAPVEEGTAAPGGAEAEDDAGGLGAGKSSYVPPHCGRAVLVAARRWVVASRRTIWRL
ncbi:Eukaryotic translation initiation factor 3 subunit G [Penicillium robsamsonii]|uniref:Eukaryotic translation initiation factor 3 subunit G n=1 Tax=Penicillium robsamsonii TaxID=1792511 RepID=UPI002548DC30|nr:Eukaryotic translation initiation factor 3 subunit G [Penicillium robsamsonii]KAJ5825146.1 Eukaryotic translation initiation factor 3 subunit G [Penicillium robsamsonii]